MLQLVNPAVKLRRLTVALAISLKDVASMLSQLDLDPAHKLYRGNRGADSGGAHHQEEDDTRHPGFLSRHR
jgi:hypothetical protein